MTSEINRLIDSLSSTHVDDQNGGVLSFEGKQLKLNTAEDAEPIAREIEKFGNSLKVLILKGNTINFPAAERISEALKKCPNLQRALWSDIFTGRSKAETPPSLKFFCSAFLTAKVSLTELDLSDNALSIAGAEAIKDLLSSSACYSLEVLKLNNGGLGIGGGKIIAQALIDCWEAGKREGKPLRLKVFIAGRNRLENPGAEALAIAFKKIGTLEEVAMFQNGIYYRGVTALAKAFSVNHNLTRINLSDNTFTVLGALAMADVLPQLKKLEVINFSDCLLRSKGGLTLAKALKNSCFNLKELCVSGNELNSDAALSMADAVMNGKKSFEKLDIGCNNIGQSGLDDLKDLFSRKNAAKCLASLSDDEGTADEDEEENDDHQNVDVSHEQEEEYEDDEEGEYEDDEEQGDENDQALSPTEQIPVTDNYIHDDTSLRSGGEGEPFETNPVQKFLTTYDVDTLRDLGSGGPELISQYLQATLHDAHFAVDCLSRISSLITPKSDTIVKDLAFSSCEKILKTCFSVCDVALFTDFLAAKLGLIKSEEKEDISNTFGFILFLEQECSRTYFSKTTRDVLRFLIEKHIKKIPKSESYMWTNLFNALQM